MKRAYPTNKGQRHLPRLTPEFYRGFAFVFWTHTTQHRACGWLTSETHAGFREILLHACARYHLLCPVYTVMPDHAHLLWLGVAPESDQNAATRFLRQHLAPVLHPVGLQKQPHDHVLREDERERNALQSICHYIQENPVRKGLVSTWTDYVYTGCMLPGYPELNPRTHDYWQRFWRMYSYVRSQHEPPQPPPNTHP